VIVLWAASLSVGAASSALAQSAPAMPTPTPMPAAAAAPAPVDQNAWANGLLLDHRARQAGDLVTVQIVENITAIGTADSNLDKNSKSGGTLPWPIPTKWAGALSSSAETQFTGGGTTSRAATITAVMSARVVERHPNGDLAIVGVREIVINGDRQFVTLSGIIRASDVAKGNVIASPMISDLRIQYTGQGFMKDNLSPGWLIRFLNKIF
jgi:flagellar L-ring protein precursor FlgH